MSERRRLRGAVVLAATILTIGASATLGATGCGDSSGSGGSGAATATHGATGTTTGSPTTTTGATGSTSTGGTAGVAPVFVIVLENHNWSAVKGAPFTSGLLAMGAHAEQAFTPPGLHPSEPNYLWLEAGTSFGIKNDSDPSTNHQATTDHLVTELEKAGRSWKSYQEDIDGTTCPLTGVKKYATKHNPMVFFDDVTDTNSASSAHCIAHVRPYTELATDLTNDTIADYNFITPNLCNDTHDSCAPQNDPIKQGDDWLSMAVPAITQSKAYARGAVVIVTWDEGTNDSDGPIGLIVLSKSAKLGHAGMVKYTHSSTLKTVQEILGVTPLLGGAADAATADLSDLFNKLPTPM